MAQKQTERRPSAGRGQTAGGRARPASSRGQTVGSSPRPSAVRSWTDSRVNALADKVAREIRALGIPVDGSVKEIHINTRTRKRLGACYRHRKPTGGWTYSIEVSRHALNFNDEQLCSILAHELLHTCPGCFDHGKKWKEYGQIVSASLGYYIQRTVDYSKQNAGGFGMPESGNAAHGDTGEGFPWEEKVKYVIICPVCGQRYERRRMCPLVKNPARYRCGRCGAKLKCAVQPFDAAKSTTSCR